MLSACSTGVFHCKLYPRSISSWLCSFIDGLPQPSHWEFVVHLWIWSCCVSSSVHCFFSPFLFFKLDGKAGEVESAWSKEKLFFLFTSVFVNSEIQKTPTRESCGYWGIQQTMLKRGDLISSERTGWGSSLLLHQHCLWLQVLSGQPLLQECFTQQPFAATAPWRC